ncbi:MAG: hypothetical protein IJ147_00550 [Lachnospiraceae bacterium]|nr:hypothetical protein [Lachnospiraceae bacterium]
MAKRKQFSLFWCLYFIFVITMVLFWIGVGSYVKRGLVRFEESQPARAMDSIMERFRQEGFREYLQIGEISPYETADDYAAVYQSRIDGKAISYGTAAGYQDPAAPRYVLYADDEAIGTVTLKEVATEPFLRLLTISTWDLDTVELEVLKADHSVEIVAPAGYPVYVNGIPVGGAEQTGEAKVPEEFAYAAAYVEVPEFAAYRIDGLICKPEITVYDKGGSSVAMDIEEQDKLTHVEVTAFAESEMPKDLSAMVLDQVEKYTNFFSGDLPGCHSSVAPLKEMFPADSYYLELAETYRKEDMWMYSDHGTPKFKNESVSHYIRYNEELFSCEVYFTKEMLLTKWNSMREDTVNFRLYYGLVNGAWKILDMQTLLDET